MTEPANDLPHDACTDAVYAADKIFNEFHNLADLLVPQATEGTAQVLTDIAMERVEQVEKWGVQTRPDGTGGQWVPAATEAKRITDLRMADGTATWLDILLEEVFEAAAEDDHDKLREELVQVAAVAASWVEDIDRKAIARKEEFGIARADNTLPVFIAPENK